MANNSNNNNQRRNNNKHRRKCNGNSSRNIRNNRNNINQVDNQRNNSCRSNNSEQFNSNNSYDYSNDTVNDYNDTTNQNNKRGRGATTPGHEANSRVAAPHALVPRTNEDDDLKISDYLYMKDKKHSAITATHSRDAGLVFPHPIIWRYMSDEGGEEPAPALAATATAANGKLNDGLVASAHSGLNQSHDNQTLKTMSRSARQRARRAARKAEAAQGNNSIAVGGGGTGSSLNTFKQQPQKQHTKNISLTGVAAGASTAQQPAAATITHTRTRVMDGRGMWTWDDECDEWDRPLNVLEAMDILADMDRLNWESKHGLSNPDYELTPSPPSTPRSGAIRVVTAAPPVRVFDIPPNRMGTIRAGSASAVPNAPKENTVDYLKTVVSVHTGGAPPKRIKSFAGGFRGAMPGDPRIVLPVEINGVVLTAMLASGRAKSCIDRQVAAAIGLKVWTDPSLEMIDHYRTASTQRTCNAVEATCNGHSTKTVLDVDDLIYYDFQIGADLFRAFGVSIVFCG
ncbi:hypothetical protein BGW39_000466 [Mortierella sp. 14UC]|nr:hypothetical protein BGW39_000466 [Mortierella sp. 14UC]